MKILFHLFVYCNRSSEILSTHNLENMHYHDGAVATESSSDSCYLISVVSHDFCRNIIYTSHVCVVEHITEGCSISDQFRQGICMGYPGLLINVDFCCLCVDHHTQFGRLYSGGRNSEHLNFVKDDSRGNEFSETAELLFLPICSPCLNMGPS